MVGDGSRPRGSAVAVPAEGSPVSQEPTPTPTPMPTPTIAVAIPCFNEAGAILAVVEGWRRSLPEAEIVVFDNNSTDGTGAIARRIGVRVVEVRDQGKGYAVRAIFEDLADRDVVILVDGDGTYPPEAARALVDPILAGRAEMTVGARQPVEAPGAMTVVRGIGNYLITWTFRLLIGPATRDLLTGFRGFSRQFLQLVTPRSAGFEIEAELAGQAVARGLATVEIEVAYLPRIAGTASKLRAVRDGTRIGLTILRQSLRYKAWRPLGLLAVGLGMVQVALHLLQARLTPNWPVGPLLALLQTLTLVILAIALGNFVVARLSRRRRRSR